MDQSANQTIASFTGKLLRTRATAGDRLVQLVFREGKDDWLCVSSNLADAALPVGRTYRIEGTYRELGERPFIHEPAIAPLARSRGRLKLALIIPGVILLLSGAAAAVVVLRPRPAATPKPTAAQTQPSQNAQSQLVANSVDQNEVNDDTAAATTTTGTTAATPTQTAAGTTNQTTAQQTQTAAPATQTTTGDSTDTGTDQTGTDSGTGDSGTTTDPGMGSSPDPSGQ